MKLLRFHQQKTLRMKEKDFSRWTVRDDPMPKLIGSLLESGVI